MARAAEVISGRASGAERHKALDDRVAHLIAAIFPHSSSASAQAGSSGAISAPDHHAEVTLVSVN